MISDERYLLAMKKQEAKMQTHSTTRDRRVGIE
jgi:hypothetical protein